VLERICLQFWYAHGVPHDLLYIQLVYAEDELLLLSSAIHQIYISGKKCFDESYHLM
jgi:hypothetical protein